MKQIFILSLLVGVLGKLYDDLNDNVLFKNWTNPHVNEYLKGAHYILLIMVSEVSLYLMFAFIFLNIPLMFTDTSAFPAYEFSGMLVGITYFIYKILTMQGKYFVPYKFIAGLVLCSILTSIDILIVSDTEFSYKKLLLRGTAVVFFGLLVLLNNKYNVVPSNATTPLYYFIGYCFVSCIFQSISLYIESRELNECTTEDVSSENNTEEISEEDTLNK